MSQSKSQSKIDGKNIFKEKADMDFQLQEKRRIISNDGEQNPGFAKRVLDPSNSVSNSSGSSLGEGD